MTSYHLWPLATLISVSYFLTRYLVKKKVMTLLVQRKLFNLALAFSFALNLLTNLLYMVQIGLGRNLNLPFNLTFWHIETGIIFSLLAIFHTFWHWPYYKKIIGK